MFIIVGLGNPTRQYEARSTTFGISNGSYRILIRLTHQIRSILMLSGTLSRCYPILQKFITSLAAEHCMTVCARKSIGNIRLASQTISSILYFPINDISGNTITLRHI